MIYRVLLSIGVVCLQGVSSLAGTIYAPIDDADVQTRNDNNPPVNVTGETSAQLIAGCAGAVGQDRCAVIPVQLPDFGAVSSPFTNASFIFNYEAKNNTVIGNVDVYGLARRVSPQVLTNDYWTATGSVDPTDADLLDQDVITANSPAYGLRTVENAALIDYLNAQYAGGAGAGEHVFFRLSTDTAQTGAASRYLITSADAGTAETAPRIVYNEAPPPPVASDRPFIWVRDSEKADILSKIAGQSWAQNIYNGIVSRVDGDVSAHQSNRDSFIRNLPVIWTANPPIYKTYPAYSEARLGSMDLFNTGVDCALLHYLSGDDTYARCAADLLHNAVKTMLPVTPSSSVGNGGWIFQDTSNGLLYEARVMGAQLPVIYDFLHAWLLDNQVYDVESGGMVDFSFSDAQEVFRTYYELTRDHGSKDSNWSALMSTTMLNCLLALDDEAERNAALQVYLTTGSSRQASLDYEYRYYGEAGSVWPESLQYAAAVGEIRSVHMAMLERYDPTWSLFDSYPNLPLSLPRIRDFVYPNESEQISFGDGKRRREGQSFFEYELIYRHAKDRGYTELESLMGSLISGGIAAGEYNRSAVKSYSQFGPKNEPLQLLWQEPTITEAPAPHVLPRTDELPFAGITLQRNLPPNGDPDHGLMGFVGGAAHIHSHACGMAIELYGMGQVMGAKAGRTTYGETINERFYRVFAGNNTIIVNGASRGEGGWKGLGIDTVATVSMEPQPFAAAVSSNLSFTCSSFDDSKGSLAEATQQRTLAIVRTSDTSGFYVDLFRSRSTVTSRTATTLNGDVTDQFHDYIYRNIGDLAMTIETNGATLPLYDQANRFQSDIGDAIQQPGWRYFSNTTVSYPHQADLFAQFKATPSGESSIYMDLHMPAVATREVAQTDSPAIVDAPAPYDNRDAPTVVIRKIGDAWDEPFVSVFEPHHRAAGGTVQHATALWRSGTVVGVRVDSLVGGHPVTHYVFSNPYDNQTYTDHAIGLSFVGRFGIVADYGNGDYELYIGDGRSMTYGAYTIASVSGDTEASLICRIGQAPILTANTPVNVTMDNLPPYMSVIADQSISVSTNTGPLAFTVGDDATPAGSIALAGGSSNTSLVPAANIVFGGSDSNRTVTVTPAVGQVGVAEISVIANDGTLSATNSFILTVEPPPPPLPELLAGWDTWNSGSAPAASLLAPDITGTAVTTTEGLSWHANDGRGASADGDWGTFAGPPTASTVAGDGVTGENLELPNATTGGTITFTITNNGALDIILNAFHFDAYAFRPKAARAYELSVLPGSGITDGVIYTSADDEITHVGGAWDNLAHDDIDHDLKGLADHTLGAGESVAFLLAFSSGEGDGSGGHDLWVDNAALTGSILPATEPPLLEYSMRGGDLVFTWSGGGFTLQISTDLNAGNWEDYPNGGTPPVTVAPTNPAAFYRLMEE